MLLQDEHGRLSRDGDLCFIVTKESACRIGYKDEMHDRLPLPTDHSDLVKFPNRADDGYSRVLNKLKTLVADAPAVVQRRFSRHIGTYQ